MEDSLSKSNYGRQREDHFDSLPSGQDGSECPLAGSPRFCCLSQQPRTLPFDMQQALRSCNAPSCTSQSHVFAWHVIKYDSSMHHPCGSSSAAMVLKHVPFAVSLPDVSEMTSRRSLAIAIDMLVSCHQLC